MVHRAALTLNTLGGNLQWQSSEVSCTARCTGAAFDELFRMKEFNRGILRSFCKDTNKVLSHFYGFSLEVTVKCIPSLSSPTTLWSNFPKCHSGQRMMETFLIIIGPSYWHSPLITVSRTAELSPLYEDNILRSKEESRGMWLIPHPREGWISFYWHVIVSLVVFEFEESWCTSDLCSFSNPRRKGWWEAFCPIQISQRCNCRVGDSKSGTSDKVTEQTATTNNPGISAGTIILLTEHNDDPGAKKKESEVSERCKESSWCVCSMVS